MGTKQIKELFEFLPKSKRNAKYGQETGDYPFFASSNTVTKFVTEPDYTRNKLVIGDGGTASINYAEKDFSCSDHCYVLKPIDEEALNCKYIFWYLNTNLHILEAGFKGIGIKNISKTYIQNIELTIPSKEEQDKVVSILDKADEIRAKKRLANEKLDEFLKSTFISMFGDPVKNPNNYSKSIMEELAERISDGPFGSNLKTEHYTDSGIRVIRLQNIGVNKFIDNDKAYISETYYENVLKKYTCLPNDIILGTMGNPNLRACLLPKEIGLAINKADCVQFRVNKRIINERFMCYLINSESFLNSVILNIHGQTRGRISKGQFSKFESIVPPIEQQNKFAQIVEKVEAQKQKNEQVIEQMDNLFNSLSQRAFKGEL